MVISKVYKVAILLQSVLESWHSCLEVKMVLLCVMIKVELHGSRIGLLHRDFHL